MRKNSYRLGVHPASYYASLFDEAEVSIQPAHGGWPELGVVTIGHEDFEIDIFMPSEEGGVPERFVAIARSVSSCVVEMDEAARADPRGGPIDEDEILFRVWIRDTYVEFEYYSTRVNTQWSVYFTPSGQAGWDYRGFQPP